MTQIRFLGYEDSVRLVLSPKAPPAFTQCAVPQYIKDPAQSHRQAFIVIGRVPLSQGVRPRQGSDDEESLTQMEFVAPGQP